MATGGGIEYPKMLYRPGGAIQIDGRGFDTLIVPDVAAHDAATGEGWAAHPDDMPLIAETIESAPERRRPGRPRKAES